MSSTPDPRALPPAGRAIVGAAGIFGFLVLVISLLALSRIDIPLQWVAFSLLTFAAGTLMLKVPSMDVLFSISEVFAFSCVVLYGPELATVTVAVDTLLLSLRRRHSAAQTMFNFGNLTLAVWISGVLFFAVAAVPPLVTHPELSSRLMIAVAVLAAIYFLVNSGLMAALVGAQTRRPPLAIWREHFMGLAPTYAAAASVALLLVVALRQVDFSVVALIPPLLLISYLTLRSSFGRLEDAKRHVEKVNGLYLSTIETLATAIDAKDEVTHGHIRRVQAAAVGLARELGISDETTIKAIEAAALLHDTGKIAVPEHILNKPGKLTPAEFEKMKLHAPIGAEILSSIEFPYPVVPIVRHHHENWDGTGYPDRIAGTAIPIGARILSVVDCFDALTSDRPYRPRMTDEQALRILGERRGTMYDPVVVDAFVAAHTRIMPAETSLHPAAKAVGGARTKRREAREEAQPAPPPAAESVVPEEVLGVSSLARALEGHATLPDVGALFWMMLKQVVPCTSMGLFVPDEATDTVVGRYASGTHAATIRALSTTPGDGVVGWVAANRRPAANAEPALDFGLGVLQLDPPLLSSVALPLVHEGKLLAVLSVYSSIRQVFTEDHARLLELMAPKLAHSLAAVNLEGAFGAPAAGVDRRATAASDLKLLKGGRAAARG